MSEFEKVNCFLCDEKIEFANLNDHFRCFHRYDLNSDGENIYFCSQNNCASAFISFTNYKMHLKRFHLTRNSPILENESPHNLNEMVEDDNIMHADIPQHVDETPEAIISSIFLDLKKRGNLTITNINVFADSMKTILCAFNSYFEKTKNSGSSVSAAVENFAKLINMCKKDTNFSYIESTQIYLGSRREKRKRGGMTVFRDVQENFQYISIIENCKLILSNKNMRTWIEKEKSSEHTFCSFRDGSMYKNSEYFEKYPNALRINLYYDEIEVANPIGSKGGIHKIGMFYYTIQNLPYYINSSLEGIFILAIVYDIDVKKYGFKKILEPFMKELEELESDNGVQFMTKEGEIVVLRATLVSFTGMWI